MKQQPIHIKLCMTGVVGGEYKWTKDTVNVFSIDVSLSQQSRAGGRVSKSKGSSPEGQFLSLQGSWQ